ncbi:MAG: SRPBCC domain-containing protein [Acidimicrobiales bacterium]
MKDILHRVVELPCTVEEAWDHILDPSWLGEDGELDPVPGGEGWVTSDGETHYLLVEEVDEDERFVYRWASFTDEPSRVEIDLAPTSAGTRIEIIESPLNARMMSLA